jgi:hypothetical protein
MNNKEKQLVAINAQIARIKANTETSSLSMDELIAIQQALVSETNNTTVQQLTIDYQRKTKKQ